MVAIDNKSNSGSNLVGIKQNIAVDEVDMLFAELFSLVNSEDELENINSENNLLNISESKGNSKLSLIKKEQNNDQKTEDLAKSLVQIFYKDLGIMPDNEGKKTNLGSNALLDKKNSLKEHTLKFDQNKINQTQNKNQKGILKTDFLDKNIQQEKISVTVSFNPPKKNLKMESTIIQSNDLNTKNLEIDSKMQLLKTEKSNLNELNSQKNSAFSGQVSEKKKTSKKKQSSITTAPKEEEIEISKNLTSTRQNLNQIKGIAQKNFDNGGNFQKIKKDRNEQSFENKTRATKLFATPETLNLMESSWGEKFSKMVRNAVNNGLNKVEITLKPKSLGKINLDISVKDNMTKIQINAENQESANLLNENLGKINELIESKNDKFSNFFDGGSNNQFNNQKKQKIIDNQQVHNKKKSADNEKTVISNHNIDVQA